MGKASSKKQTRRDKIAHSQIEGTLEVSFLFDGKTYYRQHQLTAREIAHMKELCRDHGEAAADQVVWKMAVRYSGFFAENVVALAGKEYCDANFKGPQSSIGSLLSNPAGAGPTPTYVDLVAAEEAEALATVEPRDEANS